MQLIMLGTGHAGVLSCYNTCFILKDENLCFLVDTGGGNGLLKQLQAVDIPINQIHDVFVTHKHTDHITGIVWLLRMVIQGMKRGQYEGDLCLYSHEEVIRIIYTITTMLFDIDQKPNILKRLHFITVQDKESKDILHKEVTFFDIQSTKARQFGFTMQLNEADKLTCLGDEPYHECEAIYVQDSKWLLHEAFCLYEEKDIYHPYEIEHSTVKDACELAQRMGVENLVLYHTEESHLKDRKRLYTQEGRPYFKGHLYVPNDLDVLSL